MLAYKYLSLSELKTFFLNGILNSRFWKVQWVSEKVQRIRFVEVRKSKNYVDAEVTENAERCDGAREEYSEPGADNINCSPRILS